MKEVVLGIDLGGTNTKLALVDKGGHIQQYAKTDTSVHPEFAGWLSHVHSLGAEMLSHAGEDLKLVAVGIGAPNGNYYHGTIEYAPNLLWKGIIRVRELAEEKFGVPVYLNNDANAAAIGEMLFGGAKDMTDFVVITMGTGLGSGIVVNRRVLYGHDGNAGEVGHIVVEPGGRLCTCGRKGCLEAYVSARGICLTVEENLQETDIPSVLRGLPQGGFTARSVSNAANAGDALALIAIDNMAKILGFAIANVVAVTSPQAIFLFGGLAQAGDILHKPVRKYMEDSLLHIFKNKVQVLPSELPGSDAAILGAAALAWNEFSAPGPAGKVPGE